MKNNAFKVKVLSVALMLLSNSSVFATEQREVIARGGGGDRVERADDADVDINRQRDREMGNDVGVVGNGSVETVTTPGAGGSQTTVIQSGTGATTGAGMVVPNGEDLNRARDSGDFDRGARDFRGR